MLDLMHMRRWRRFIAAVLALALVPSSALAAMPLVWCVGLDGHRAVEFSRAPAGKHTDHRALGQQLVPDALSATQADGDSCQDWQLVGPAEASASQDHAGLLTFDLRTVEPLPELPTLVVTAADPTFRTVRANHSPPPDLRRTALRSVVLLI